MLVEIDPARMAGVGVTVADLRSALQSANLGLPVGELISGNRAVAIESGPFLRQASEVGDLVVGVRDGKPVFLRDVAAVRDGPLPAAPLCLAWRRRQGRRRRDGAPGGDARDHQEAGRERHRRGRRGDAPRRRRCATP